METATFTDHPGPGTGLLLLMSLFLIGFLAAFPVILFMEIQLSTQILICVFLLLCSVILVYAFWLLNNTRYEIYSHGIRVIYGRSSNLYEWSDFNAASHRPGLFTLKIGWLGITPCVRLKNAVVLKRSKTRFSLYLTPADPANFLNEIRQAAPQLFN